MCYSCEYFASLDYWTHNMPRMKRIAKELWSCYLGVACVLSVQTYLYFMYKFKMAGLW